MQFIEDYKEISVKSPYNLELSVSNMLLKETIPEDIDQ